MELRLLPLLCVGCTGFQMQTTFDDGGVPTTPQILADSRSRPQDVVVGGGFVYWVEQGSFAMSGRDGRVLRMPVGGCEDADCPKVMAQNLYSPGGIALSLDATLLFYCELADAASPTSSSGRIWRVVLGGVETPAVFAMNQGGPRKLAADQTAIYWVNGKDGEVRRAWTDGSLPDGAIVTGLSSPVELTLDVAATEVFWTNYGNSDFGGTVMGFTVGDLAAQTIASSQPQPHGLSLGPTYVYWANFGNGTVMRARRNGKELDAFASDRLSPNDVLVDGDWLYLAEAGSAPYYRDGRVVAMKLDGSETRVLAEKQKYPRSLASDAGALYWVNLGTYDSDGFDGAVMRIAKP